MTINHISTPILLNTYQSPDWYASLWQASRKGALQEIVSIIEQSHLILANFPAEFTQCFTVAAREGHKDIVDFFLSVNILKVIKLEWLVYGLDSDHKEIVDAVINSIKLDKDSLVLAKVFNAALANDCIKTVKAITKFIEPLFLHGALKSILEKNQIESEGFAVSRFYGNLVEATISSLTPELSWEIIKVDAGIVNAGSTDNSIKVVEAITRSIDPSFLYSALKSSIEKKYYAENSSVLGYHENLIRITISSLTPELLCKILLMSVHNEVLITILNSVSSEYLCQILHLSLEQNYADFMKNIIESERILYSDKCGRAFVQAVQDHQIDVIELFINSSRFKILPSDYLDQALAVANIKIDQMIRNSDRVKNLNVIEF